MNQKTPSIYTQDRVEEELTLAPEGEKKNIKKNGNHLQLLIN